MTPKDHLLGENSFIAIKIYTHSLIAIKTYALSSLPSISSFLVPSLPFRHIFTAALLGSKSW
jgi:hypothetical protein